MAPVDMKLPAGSLLTRRAFAVAGAATVALSRRDLTVNHTQKVTLGVIGAYVAVIALLWNIPYVRNVLWPFKVGSFTFATPSALYLSLTDAI